jgi:hypothetical protein
MEYLLLSVYIFATNTVVELRLLSSREKSVEISRSHDTSWSSVSWRFIMNHLLMGFERA